MDFSIPERLSADVARFKEFLQKKLVPNLTSWTRDNALPRHFYQAMGQGGWFGFTWKKESLEREKPLTLRLQISFTNRYIYFVNRMN